jgi:hypothetical protein
LDAPRPVTIRHVSSGISKVRRSARPLGLSSFRSIRSRPRGPPSARDACSLRTAPTIVHVP